MGKRKSPLTALYIFLKWDRVADGVGVAQGGFIPMPYRILGSPSYPVEIY